MPRRTRTQIAPEVRSQIVEEARAYPQATAKSIAALVKSQLREKNISKPVPKARAIQVIAKSARAEPGYTPNDPWNLGFISSDIPADATGDILAVWRLRLQQGRRLTIRQAKWVARLRSALPAAAPEALLVLSTLYERRERTVGRPQPLNTVDLDAELAFQVWKSPLHDWEYQQAVLTGAVPGHGPIGSEVMSLFDLQMYPILDEFFSCHARQFLREVGGDGVDQQPWWPQAESVMAFWLRVISTRVKKWELVDDLTPEELGADVWKEWQAMGQRLAELVIAKARELASGGRAVEIMSEKEGGYYSRQSWRPAELLKEIGYYEEGNRP